MRSKSRSAFRRPASSRLRIENADKNEAAIYLYEEIGYWGVNAKDFTSQLSTITAETIHLHINSPGGDVFDGLAMANALRKHPANVVTHVDALAASIASVIALAGDRIEMADNAFFMVHHPWTIMMGNAKNFREQADLLDKIGDSIVSEYMKATGEGKDTVVKWMDEETWFNAEEAMDAGFIDAIDTDVNEDAADEVAARYDLSIFRHAPAALVTRERTRDQHEMPTIRELEQAARDAGLSRSQAKQLVAAGLQAIQSPRDAEQDSRLVEGLQQLVSTLQS